MNGDVRRCVTCLEVRLVSAFLEAKEKCVTCHARGRSRPHRGDERFWSQNRKDEDLERLSRPLMWTQSNGAV